MTTLTVKEDVPNLLLLCLSFQELWRWHQTKVFQVPPTAIKLRSKVDIYKNENKRNFTFKTNLPSPNHRNFCLCSGKSIRLDETTHLRLYFIGP